MDIVIRRQSEYIHNKYQEKNNRIFHDRKWEWGYLRKQCQNLELEQFYKTYMQRLQRSYLSIFIVIQAIVGGIHSILLLTIINDKVGIFPEIFSYLACVLLVWGSLVITFREDLIKRRPFIGYIASFLAVFILVVSDIIVPLYHASVNFPNPPLRPSYASYILYAIYIFIPLSENWHAFILGVAVTFCYILNFVMITYRLDDFLLIKTATEGIFLICVNCFGLYYRLMKEIAVRTTFLDRRECVEENLLLRYNRDQEKSLLLSIIPPHTAEDLEQDIRKRIEKIKKENQIRHIPMDRTLPSSKSISPKRWRRPDTEKLFIAPHKNVSILYADVVNYTYLTTTLDVKPLVETLHELFVKFDQASEEYNCLRIKFLGDCYYCVSGISLSGISQQNDHHAKSCVDLGLRMIRDIREVRSRRKLDIDMRIGVHSGAVWSGVIGAVKWQYDIWSKDVDIANRLESTGKPGRVHVSRETLRLLDGEYLYEEGTKEAKADKMLHKYGIETFLIKPAKFYIPDDGHHSSIGVRRIIENNKPPKLNDYNTNFMQNSIEQYNQIRIQAKLEMARELDKMPIGKFHLSKFCLGSHKRLTQDELEEQRFRSNVSTIFLFFKDIRWEFLYLKEPDVMLKYSCLIGLLSFIGIVCLQGINKPRSELFWIVNGAAASIIILLVILSWYKKLWIIIMKSPTTSNTSTSTLTGPDEESLENNDESTSSNNNNNNNNNANVSPQIRISKLLYYISDRIMRNIFLRLLIYITIVLTLCASSLLQLIDCGQYQKITVKSFNLSMEAKEHHLCFNPWAITESLILTICMSFLFVGIPFLFKFAFNTIIIGFYSWVIFGKYAFIYHLSTSTNLGLDSEYSHLLIIIISFAIFHLMDRQNEYISKVDYNWKRQLLKKHEDAEFTKETIQILVENILPSHVAEIYMARKMKNELYTEQYENVAIMFASIRNYDIEKVGLRVLNDIICDFDDKLTNYKGLLKIEKIKVCGWTYMAACGLDITRCESTISFSGKRSVPGQRASAVFTNGGRRSVHSNAVKRLSLDQLQNNNEQERQTACRKKSQNSKNVVYVMTEFALELMKTLRSFNTENFQNENGNLRIGISHGEIMAGVVGSSKPLYDVWGNAVNMASRMDTTGIVGRIQVTEETAQVLKSFRIKCDYRGLTYVKGRTSKIPTYFVCIDENLNFIEDTTSIDSNNKLNLSQLPFDSTSESDTKL